jgi:hypothetical protein
MMNKVAIFLLLTFSGVICQEQYISNFSFTNPILLSSTSLLIASRLDTIKTDQG